MHGTPPSRDTEPAPERDDVVPVEISICVEDIFTSEETLIWALRARLRLAIAGILRMRGGMAGQPPEDRPAPARGYIELTMQFDDRFHDVVELMLAADRVLVRMLVRVWRGQTIGMFRARAAPEPLPLIIDGI